jgi:uncharacterized damage-inducible protein DinB
MSAVAPILDEFKEEAPVTRRILERVPIERADWKPHEKSMSLGRLASWLANAPGWVAAAVGAEGFDLASFQPFPAPTTQTALLAAFDEGVLAAVRAAEALDEETARLPWSFRAAGRTLSTYPRFAVLRLFLLSDAIHHRGQMTVYLRLLDVPVPSVYGPSADENPHL